ncbi:galactose mutarotase-like protein [Dendrothele bispora CBS 962.96]|uniref:Galactose mutarotase-like protein n=1 Tax=Dendrothele bispora (strain CBS 962.96) TaxID=1314807 RepID=A0A4S8L397_DENBC|nr:galactose mutarotase-like protein [Dendrothele bispora CBS 962.96]THU96165.1 galactose mutarotase-like protein [Dendrothele bispora CBS 962.96]
MAEFQPVLLTLPSLSPALVMEVLPYGLTFHRIIVQADGRTHDIVIGPEQPDGHVTQKYTNTIIGRYANRIPVGKHALERNGVRAEFEAQANESPRVSLHGGPSGFNTRTWSLIDITPSSSSPPSLFSKTELAHLSPSNYPSNFGLFRYTSPDGEQGYPGELLVEALVALVPPAEQDKTYLRPGENKTEEEYNLGSIVYVYRAKVNKGVTPVNLTNHWGFNLDASLKENDKLADVRSHTLKMKADRIVARDADSLNTNNFISTSSASAHNHNGKKIGEDYPEAGYDDFYVFQPQKINIPKRLPLSSLTDSLDLVKDLLTPAKNSSQTSQTSSSSSSSRGARTDPVVELASEKSGLKLVFDTNQSGAMFYSNGLSKATSGARKKIHGGSGIKDHGDAYEPGTAAFLEFHDILSAFLDPANKNKEDTLLTSDELYNNYVRCDVMFKEPVPAQRSA